jgi:hypothetical protein
MPNIHLKCTRHTKIKGNTTQTEEKNKSIKSDLEAGHQWLMSIILAIQEAEIRRTEVQSQSRQIVHQTLPQKYPKKGLCSDSSGRVPT